MHRIMFNPTAIAMQYDGTQACATAIDDELKTQGFDHKVPLAASLKAGMYVVIFMGQVTEMTEHQFRSAQGLV
jgi:hypothetical protein